MNNFEKITASPETLGAFLASMPIATGPWDEQFHRYLLFIFHHNAVDHIPIQDALLVKLPHTLGL